MTRLFRFKAAALLVLSLASCLSGISAREIDAARMALERRYTTPHSLGDHYVFDPRDGWEPVNTTNLLYKYAARDSLHSGLEGQHSYSHGAGGNTHNSNTTLVARARKTSHAKPKKMSVKDESDSNKSSSKSATGFLNGIGKIGKIMDSLKGIGKPEPVTITWYVSFLTFLAM